MHGKASSQTRCHRLQANLVAPRIVDTAVVMEKVKKMDPVWGLLFGSLVTPFGVLLKERPICAIDLQSLVVPYSSWP